MKQYWESESIEILPHRQIGRGSCDYEKILVVVPTSDTSVVFLPQFSQPSMGGTREISRNYTDVLPRSRKWQPTPVCLPGKFTDRGAWRATVHGVTESNTTEHAQFGLFSRYLCLYCIQAFYHTFPHDIITQRLKLLLYKSL